jgi:hypothetical protein
MRLPVERRSKEVSSAELLLSIARCAVSDAMFVLIDNGILILLKSSVYLLAATNDSALEKT